MLPALKNHTASDFSRDYPVFLFNDVDAALAEEKKNHNCDNLIVIMMGTGIGMISDGRKIQGATGFAGELGYTTVNTSNGPGFPDSVSSGAGLLEQFADSAEELKESLSRGETFSLSYSRCHPGYEFKLPYISYESGENHYGRRSFTLPGLPLTNKRIH